MNKFTPKIRQEKSPAASDLAAQPHKKPDAVEVFCRIRGLHPTEEGSVSGPSCLKILSSTVLALTTPKHSNGVTNQIQPKKEVHCTFRHIFPAKAGQKELFTRVGRPLLEGLLSGQCGLMFTYGVTGSGKTYTLNGTEHEPGLIPMCIHALFNTVGECLMPRFMVKSDRMNGFEMQDERDAQIEAAKEEKVLQSAQTRPKTLNTGLKNWKEFVYSNDGTKVHCVKNTNLFAIFVQYTEIYNNTVYDLLDEKTARINGTPQGKLLREDAQKCMYVNGVVEVEVKSAEHALELLNAGRKRKRMGTTLLNAESSRSHSIFTIRLVRVSGIGSSNVAAADKFKTVLGYTSLKVSQLCLVDLAGSERANRTQNTGKLLKEASQINNSLMTLRSCLDILRENQLTCGLQQQRLVPYRDSRLTLLFKNYFEGGGRVSVMVCVNPSVRDFEENLQVVKFAESSQDVKLPKEELYSAPNPTPGRIYLKKRRINHLTPSQYSHTPLKHTAFQHNLIPPSPKTIHQDPPIKEPKHPPVILTDLPVIQKGQLFNIANIEESVTNLANLIKVQRERASQYDTFVQVTDKCAHNLRQRLANALNKNGNVVVEKCVVEEVAQNERNDTESSKQRLSESELRRYLLVKKQREHEAAIQYLKSVIDGKDTKISGLEEVKAGEILSKTLDRRLENVQSALKNLNDFTDTIIISSDDEVEENDSTKHLQQVPYDFKTK